MGDCYLFGNTQIDRHADWQTPLVTANESIVTDVRRRIHAIQPVLVNGLVVCPTNVGRVVAVDQKSGKVAWTHEYAPVGAKRFETFAPEWTVGPPIVSDGRVVYGPADFPELLCLSLTNGKKAWSLKKRDGLYPAVMDDRVLVVGEKSIRGHALANGAELWTLDLPGISCGRGTALGSRYLVPVADPTNWRGQIVVVDPKAGKIVDVLKPKKDEPIGNLVVHGEFLLTQTVTEVAVYRLLKVK